MTTEHAPPAWGTGVCPEERARPPLDNVVLRVSGIRKQFPGVLALDDVCCDVRRGEVHALCGENGAGKSTLMKIISGLYKPDRGTIVYQGKERRFSSSLEAQAAGIAIIHQELNLAPHLSVAENIYLAREPRKGFFLDGKRMEKDAKACLDWLKVDVSPSQIVRFLPVARQQMVEIAKALSMNAEVLIMDEPTSSLTGREIDRLFEIIRELKATGVGIVYISHRLDELERIADRVTILRDGKCVATHRRADITVDAVVKAMVGRPMDEKYPARTAVPTAEVLFRVQNLRREGVFDAVSFDLRRGEILGFAGLMGAGRTEVARAIFAADRKSGGRIFLGARELHIDSPADAIKNGIAYLSEDRKLNGIAVKMSVKDNLTMANLAAVTHRFGFIEAAKEKAVAEKYVKMLDIKTPSIEQIVYNLSGGNQQKVVIGKWLFRESKILFFDEPTRGIDVGAKFAVYQLLDRLAHEGIGVVMISSELPEILGVTDRVVVFHEGRVKGILETRKTSQEEIMEYASGVKAMDISLLTH